MNVNYKPLVVDSFDNLADKDFDVIVPVVEDFLPGNGVFLFCGSSKIGKSWLALDIGLHVSTGKKFWDYEVKKTSVLYLCLEDGERRLQDRMFTLANEYPSSFYYTTESMTIDTNLIQQLDEQMKIHPDIGLIIIDTLAAIRGEQIAVSGNVYLGDYNIVRSLHEFALKHNITILMVHHVRKLRSVDPFDDISGSNGLYGASDGAFIMRRETFNGDSTVKLYHRHRDMEERIYTIDFDKSKCKWNLIDAGTPAEDIFKTDPDLRKVIEYMNEHDEFSGLAQEFCDKLGLRKKAQSISGKLSNRRHQLEKMGILFEKRRTREGSVITLIKVKNDDLPYEIPDYVEEGDGDDV